MTLVQKISAVRSAHQGQIAKPISRMYGMADENDPRRVWQHEQTSVVRKEPVVPVLVRARGVRVADVGHGTKVPNGRQLGVICCQPVRLRFASFRSESG